MEKKGDLLIIAKGKTKKDTDQKKGHLFEKLIKLILNKKGFKIDNIPNTNYAGMEIDIDGTSEITKTPFYAECKCYEKYIIAPKLQKFFGNYMAKWLQNNKSIGIFVAIPGLNSHAKGFYKEYLENKPEISLTLFEKEHVLEILYNTIELVNPSIISNSIDIKYGTPGDWILVFTEKGFFWIQFIIPPGQITASKYLIFRADGEIITNDQDIEYLIDLYPEIGNFERIKTSDSSSKVISKDKYVEQIVEVQKSSAPFEYHYPASPDYFIGRVQAIKKIMSLIDVFLNKKTSSRGILINGNSGYGKSSLILKIISELEKKGHFGIAIDSRSASSSQFILKVLEYILKKFGNFNDIIPKDKIPSAIGGFEGSIDALSQIGKNLEVSKKVLVIFFDQFENIFNLLNVLKIIGNTFLKICDLQTNIIFGFSWKTDLIGLTSEFPYIIRDDISNSCKKLELTLFSKPEINQVITNLGAELHTKIRKDLRYLIYEFSQGYPWLLIKLCAHVKNKRESGITQIELVNSGLNVMQLFQEDVQDLSPHQEDNLRKIARLVPISISELIEICSMEEIRSLVNRRLLVRIGSKYDIYWDIFRDYLTTGNVPIKEHYILRCTVGTVYDAIMKINNSEEINVLDFQKKLKLSDKSFMNLKHHLKLLELIDIKEDEISLNMRNTDDLESFNKQFQIHLKNKLLNNRLIQEILKELKSKSKLTIEEIIAIIQQNSPYITATKETWKSYAIYFSGWMDTSNLAYLDQRKWILNFEKINNKIPDFRIARKGRGYRALSGRGYRASTNLLPRIQYGVILSAAEIILQSYLENEDIDLEDFSESTKYKVLKTLEDFGFIELKTHSIKVFDKLIKYNEDNAIFLEMFKNSALKMNSFKTFVEIISENELIKLEKSEISENLQLKLGVTWKESTSDYYIKLLFNWARNTNLCPEIYYKKRDSIRNRDKYMNLLDFIKDTK